MQAAITWSEEEEVQASNNMRNNSCSRGVVNVSALTEDLISPLTMEMLHEMIQNIAACQEELFQMICTARRWSNLILKRARHRACPLRTIRENISVIPVVNLGTPADAALEQRDSRWSPPPKACS